MSYTRSERIRRAAILVASLDESLAEALLADLPPSEAARVLAEAERLEAIDPEEQADVLEEFRRLTRGRRSSGAAVEFSASFDAGEATASATDATANHDSAVSVGEALSENDAAAMAELLAGEHPQIVAAALSRLGEDQCAAVFAALPGEMQAEALERLASLAPVDDDALSDIESQLNERLRRQRDLQARAAAGADLVRKILASTPAAQRITLLERMSANHSLPPGIDATPTPPAASTASQRAAAVDPVAQQAINLAAAIRRTPKPELHEPLILADRTEALEQLSDEALVIALRAATEETVLRALAASGESFLDRVARMLPRRQARQLRRMMRELGPTRLADLHRAQHELLRLANEHAALGAA